MSVIEGPCTDKYKVAEPTSTPAGSHNNNGESGYQKRSGGTRIPEVNRDLNSRYPKPTRKG